mmetsp:Transcript_16145/g.32374  ORF Transcript_16145/g.32374 Transcript_16145/m.32374 type:complete len:267 (+) Transcript_16145:791-1591(+)
MSLSGLRIRMVSSRAASGLTAATRTTSARRDRDLANPRASSLAKARPSSCRLSPLSAAPLLISSSQLCPVLRAPHATNRFRFGGLSTSSPLPRVCRLSTGASWEPSSSPASSCCHTPHWTSQRHFPPASTPPSPPTSVASHASCRCRRALRPTPFCHHSPSVTGFWSAGSLWGLPSPTSSTSNKSLWSSRISTARQVTRHAGRPSHLCARSTGGALPLIISSSPVRRGTRLPSCWRSLSRHPSTPSPYLLSPGSAIGSECQLSCTL